LTATTLPARDSAPLARLNLSNLPKLTPSGSRSRQTSDDAATALASHTAAENGDGFSGDVATEGQVRRTEDEIFDFALTDLG